jgi:outer membrane protein TolC
MNMKRLNTLLLGTGISVLLGACEQLPNLQPAAQAFSDNAIEVNIPADINLSAGTLSMKNFVRILSVSDESIRAQDVEAAIAAQDSLGARGLFEPQTYVSINRKLERSQTSAEEYRARGTGLTSTGEPNPYLSSSTSARMGVETKTTYGGKMDLFYEIESVRNSIQIPAARPSPEFSSIFGASLVLPLARNGGTAYNTAPVEMADIDERIAKETIRLVKSQRVFEAVKTYLMVQRAQSRVHWRSKSYETSKSLAAEYGSQVAAGLRNSVELTEANAQVSEQLGLLTEARQDLNEQVGAFQIFFLALSPELQRERWMPEDGLTSPARKYLSVDSIASVDDAVSNRAETRINSLRIERQELDVLIAENQAKPEVNLKLDATKTFLSDSYVPFREVYSNSNPYHSWRIGFEFRRGISGDIARTKELEAAKLRERQAELTMNAFRQRIASEMNGIRAIVTRANEQANEQQVLVDAYWDLYEAEQEKLKSGQSSNLEVMNRKLGYYTAKEGQSDAIAQQNLSSFLASQVSGTLLSRMNVE